MIDSLFPNGYIVIFLALIAFFALAAGCGVLLFGEEKHKGSTRAVVIIVGIISSFLMYHFIFEVIK